MCGSAVFLGIFQSSWAQGARSTVDRVQVNPCRCPRMWAPGSAWCPFRLCPASAMRWQADDAGERRFGDEFGVTPERFANLDADWRRAYIARLLPTIALGRGTEAEFGTAPLGTRVWGRPTPGSPIHEVSRDRAALAARCRQRTVLCLCPAA